MTFEPRLSGVPQAYLLYNEVDKLNFDRVNCILLFSSSCLHTIGTWIIFSVKDGRLTCLLHKYISNISFIQIKFIFLKFYFRTETHTFEIRKCIKGQIEVQESRVHEFSTATFTAMSFTQFLFMRNFERSLAGRGVWWCHLIFQGIVKGTHRTLIRVVGTHPSLKTRISSTCEAGLDT